MIPERGQYLVPSAAPLPARPQQAPKPPPPASGAAVTDDTPETLTQLARAQRAAELDAHVDYYERAATDISQALEYVEETGSEAAVALRATQRTMSSVASALRRRAAELRGEPVRNLPAPVEEE